MKSASLPRNFEVLALHLNKNIMPFACGDAMRRFSDAAAVPGFVPAFGNPTGANR
jgi:hypothetical protein